MKLDIRLTSSGNGGYQNPLEQRANAKGSKRVHGNSQGRQNLLNY